MDATPLVSSSVEFSDTQRKPAPSKLSVLILYLAFAGTGIGMALPGAILPVLKQRWGLADSHLGLFFFLGWMGSSVGALLVRPSRSRSAAGGCALVAVGLLGMAFAARPSQWAPLLWMLIYGLGLGLSMTSISLLRVAQSAERRSAELNRLNFVWAVGASGCPGLTGDALRMADVRGLFSVLASAFLILSGWLWLSGRNDRLHGGLDGGNDAALFAPQPAASSDGPNSKVRWLAWPLSLVIAIMLPTGIESSIGGWAASYVFRMQHAWSTTISAGTCFWVGLMVSRLLSAAVLRYRHAERWVFAQSLVTVVVGLSLLIVGKGGLGVVSAIFVVGLGLGPVYPMLLAMALRYSENTLIFFAAGIGSAVLPWLTGLVSGVNNSLRSGLMVPLCGSVLMLGLGMIQSRRAAAEMY